MELDTLEEWLGNMYFFETVILKQARACSKISKEDLYTMIRWAIFADKSWSQHQLRAHLDAVMPAENGMRPSRRLVAAFVQNGLMDHHQVREAIVAVTRQIPALDMTGFELHTLLTQRQAARDLFESIVAPLLSSKGGDQLRHILKGVLSGDGSVMMSEPEPMRRIIIQAAIREDSRSLKGLKLTEWVTSVILPTMKSRKEKIALLHSIKTELDAAKAHES